MASYEPVRAIQRGLAVLRGRKRTWSDHSRRTRRALRFPATYDGSHSRNTIAESYIYRVAGEPKYRVTGRVELTRFGGHP